MKVSDSSINLILYKTIDLDELAKTRIYGRNNTPSIPLTDNSIIQIIPGQVMDLLRQNQI